MPKSMRSRRSKKIKTRKRRRGGFLNMFRRSPPPPPSRFSRFRSGVSRLFGSKPQPLPAAAAPALAPAPAGMMSRLMNRFSPESQEKMQAAFGNMGEAAMSNLSPHQKQAAQLVRGFVTTARENPRLALGQAALAAGVGLGVMATKQRGGEQNVRPFNTYNDPSTMHAKPVSGYNTAMPHNWVGGRTRRRR